MGVVNVMNEITNLHPPPEKKKKQNHKMKTNNNNNKKRNDLKVILTSLKKFCPIFFLKMLV